MKKILLFFYLMPFILLGQERKVSVFNDALVHFSEKSPEKNIRLQQGRILVTKVSVPKYKKGTDVSLEIRLRSNGDPWDKAGSCFVIKDTTGLNIITSALKNRPLPTSSYGTDGIVNAENYQPAIELMRFMTPFGVGHFSDDKKNKDGKYYRPVSVPKWENEVVWKADVSQLQSLLVGDFFIGVWIDTWSEKGYKVDVTLSYSGRSLPIKQVLPLVNTIPYVNGQKNPDFFSRSSLKMNFQLPKEAKNAELYYITSGHGGHSGGDEFVQKRNEVFLNNRSVLDFIPWRDDCGSFRRFNPTSSVWVQRDTAMYFDENGKHTKGEVIERLASSDVSRSNWCPGSDVPPKRIDLGTLPKGKHQLEIRIPATKNAENEQNLWLVSAYIVF